MKKMEDPTIATGLFSSSFSPCSPNETAIQPGDCVASVVEQWLKDEVLPGFRVWQLAGIILSVLLSVLIVFCCCIRFRIPRTKQEIEADYVRKKITKCFKLELTKISNTEMNDMDLKKALSKIQNKFGMRTGGVQMDYQETTHKNIQNIHHGLRLRFNTIFSRIHCTKQEHVNTDTII